MCIHLGKKTLRDLRITSLKSDIWTVPQGQIDNNRVNSMDDGSTEEGESHGQVEEREVWLLTSLPRSQEKYTDSCTNLVRLFPCLKSFFFSIPIRANSHVTKESQGISPSLMTNILFHCYSMLYKNQKHYVACTCNSCVNLVIIKDAQLFLSMFFECVSRKKN